MTHAIDFDTTAHRLLEDLDRRLDELLHEVDALDQRTTAVLSQYIQVRPEPTGNASEPPAAIAEEDNLDDD